MEERIRVEGTIAILVRAPLANEYCHYFISIKQILSKENRSFKKCFYIVLVENCISYKGRSAMSRRDVKRITFIVELMIKTGSTNADFLVIALNFLLDLIYGAHIYLKSCSLH
jgi:hypothetical protein